MTTPLSRGVNVRARAPLRLGIGGGGSDLPVYAKTHGGVVLNATIDRYAYAHLSWRDDGLVHFRADDLEQSELLPASLDFDIRQGLILHRAVYRHMMLAFNGGRAAPLALSTTIDVPAGSGLGASSALTVALIEAFTSAMQLPLGVHDVARLAVQIEREQLGLAGGMQDQYAAAFGGFNFIEFLAGGDNVVVNPLRLRPSILNEFESSLVICFSGQSRASAEIIAQQVSGLMALDGPALEAMHRVKAHALRMKARLLDGDIPGMAEVLRESWTAKKTTAHAVTTPGIDRLMRAADEAGAWGGKVSGAGGGGFLMLMTDPEERFRLIAKLNAAGGEASAVKLTFEGAEGWTVPGPSSRRPT